MQIPNIPHDEIKRLETLNSLAVLDTGQEPLLDDITYLASEICEVPISLISLIDHDRQWFKSNVGLDAEETSRDISFCGHTILEDDIFEVEDAIADPRFVDNPLVTGYPHIRFYAGAPLIAANGTKLGTLCVIDNKPNKLNQKQRKLLVVLARDIVTQLEMRKESEDLIQSKELQTLISETNQDLIFVKDENFNIVYANNAFISLYPAEMKDKIIGYTTLEKYSKADAEHFLEQDRLAFKNGIAQKVETIVFPDKGERTLITTKKRFLSQEGQSYILGVARDITEQTTLIKSLEQSNKNLDEFAQIASHDLKAPLNAVESLLGFIEQDCQGILPSESTENFALIQNRVKRMQSLLDELLNYAQIGKTKDEYEQFSLKDCVENLKPLVDKPQAFSINTEDNEIKGPKTALNTIILNLISNAVKHHDRENGQINITSRETPSHYKLTISDDGPGISPKHHERIFNLFQTLKPRDVVEGCGMGLATVKKLIEHYEGTVIINPKRQIAGSEFTITWPKNIRGHY